MLEKYEEEINNLTEWYTYAKNAAIVVEAYDTNNNAYIQPLHEQRYALDHFIRAITYEQNLEDDEKVKKAITSAIGHLQRSYSDSIEWMLISVKEEYSEKLKPYTTEQINNGFPSYYEKIRPSLEEMTKLVNEYKISKSIEKTTTTTSKTISNDDAEIEIKDFPKQFLDLKILEKLEKYRNELLNKECILAEIQQRDNKETTKEKFIIPTISAIVGAVISGFLVALIKCL